jgi:hypothetical protein
LDRLDKEGGEVPGMSERTGGRLDLGEIGSEGGALWERVEVGECGWMLCDVVFVWVFHFGDLEKKGGDSVEQYGKKPRGKQTISRKSAPMQSLPTPLSMRDPSASLRNSENSSENLASSSMLLNIIRTSSGVIDAPDRLSDEKE